MNKKSFATLKAQISFPGRSVLSLRLHPCLSAFIIYLTSEKTIRQCRAGNRPAGLFFDFLSCQAPSLATPEMQPILRLLGEK
jgi:hypothetical protein